MSKPIVLAALCAAISSGALAQGTPNLSHNGSAMRLDVAGERVTIRYVQPRPGLAEAGVYPGAILFSGVFQGDVIVGQAVAFKGRCQPAPYNVGGRIEGGRFVLVGLGPHREGCRVVSYTANSPHSRLAFEATDQATVAMLTNQADPRRTRTAAEMLSVLRPGANRDATPFPVPVAESSPVPPPAPIPAPAPQVQAQAPSPVPVPPVPVAPLPRETVTPSAPPSHPVAEGPAAPPSPPQPRASDVTPVSSSPPTPLEAPAAVAPKPKPKPKLDADL
ncbi:hypothetical protein [Methylobacterium radiotolerans]|uniref:hypothetical protein n=1 Tax=Methylobacterium radiotolerans TaxID=31998 RepID=UPI001F290684|nr:hypothetical protein [Methylobacterium radiotolerans]UIY45844.1 hypothetical protein LZ599_32350 [Methylobacterium radiotolerans]